MMRPSPGSSPFSAALKPGWASLRSWETTTRSINLSAMLEALAEAGFESVEGRWVSVAAE